MTVQRYLVSAFFWTLATAIVVSYLFKETKPPFWLKICSSFTLYAAIIASTHDLEYQCSRALTKVDALKIIGAIVFYALAFVSYGYLEPFIDKGEFKKVAAFLFGALWAFTLTTNWNKVGSDKTMKSNIKT